MKLERVRGKLDMGKMSRSEVMESIMKDHNHSWYDDLCMRNKNNLDSVAMLFRGTKITYGEFFTMVNNYAKSLKQFGLRKGDEFVACLRQTPDYPVLVAAASLIGAKIILVAPDFHKDFLSDLIDNSNSKIVFVDDWDFVKVEDALSQLKTDKKIVTLPVSKWDKYNNPYSEITDRFFKFNEENYNNSISKFNNIIDIDEFLDEGKKYVGEVSSDGSLDDDLAITFTSGSTKKGFHKGVVQKNRSYIVMGRYHDPEVAGIPKMENTITLCQIGVQADTTLMTGISDTLLQGGTVALDPIIDEKYFIYSMKINNGGLVIATRSFWLSAMKQTYTDPELKNIKLPGLYVPSEGGEPLSAGEEKALNRWLKDVKAGTAITHTPFSIAKMTVGGGDTEQGSIFLTLYREYYYTLQKIRGINEPIGLTAYDFADIEALRKDGTYCEPMELGNLVCNAATAMDRYYNNEEETNKYYITDAYGKKWGNLNVYGYKDKWNKVYVKGRIGLNDPKIKNFEIADEISKDTKNIMSCEVISIIDEDGFIKYVAHVEPQFSKKVNIKNMLLSAEKRCITKFGEALKDNLYFRVRTFEEGFPTLFTTKRNVIALKEEGISEKCIIPSDYYKETKENVKLLKK